MNFISFQTYDGIGSRQKRASSTPTFLCFQSSYQSRLRNLYCIEKKVLLPKEPCRNGFHASRWGTSTSQALCILADLFNSMSSNWTRLFRIYTNPLVNQPSQIRYSQYITFTWWVRSTCIVLCHCHFTYVHKQRCLYHNGNKNGIMKNDIFTSMCNRGIKTGRVLTSK